MVLYHLTCEWHLETILRDGFLKVTESNIGPDGSGPRVCWLTTCPEPVQRWQVPARMLQIVDAWDKSRIRFTVDVKSAHPWSRWSRRQGIPRWWYNALTDSGGNPDEWYVTDRPVYRRDWRRVENTQTGACLWVPSTTPEEVAS